MITITKADEFSKLLDQRKEDKYLVVAESIQNQLS